MLIVLYESPNTEQYASLSMEDNTENPNPGPFDIGQPCQFLSSTRPKAKDLLLWGKHLYNDTNVKVGKNGRHYWKCVNNAKGCLARAHTLVTEGMVETYMEPPFDEEHTCEDSHMQVYGLQFFAEILKECKTNTDIPHPTLHSKMTTKFRSQLNNPQDQALFDALVVKEYSFAKIKSTMHRRRVEVRFQDKIAI